MVGRKFQGLPGGVRAAQKAGMEEGGPRNLKGALIFAGDRRERRGWEEHAEAISQRGTSVCSGGGPGLHTVVHKDEVVKTEGDTAEAPPR